jgi:hypothetical protein
MLDGTYGYDAVEDAHFLMGDGFVAEEVEAEADAMPINVSTSTTTTTTTGMSGSIEQVKKPTTQSDLSAAASNKTKTGSTHNSSPTKGSESKILLATEGCSCPGMKTNKRTNILLWGFALFSHCPFFCFIHLIARCQVKQLVSSRKAW